MIDLHCHLLPGIDDGPRTLLDALDLARAAAGEGITTIACTPHIYPGVYDNTGGLIRDMVPIMQRALDASGIPVRLVTGADVHVGPDLVRALREGHVLPLAGSRYVLVEPPHHVLPPRIEDPFHALLEAGYVPVLTHPERMTWIEQNLGLIVALARAGVMMQVTAGAFLDGFGPRASYWAERLLDQGLVHIVATDAHDARDRPPCLGAARARITARVGPEEARRIFVDRPEAILADQVVPLEAPGPGPSAAALMRAATAAWLTRALGRARAAAGRAGRSVEFAGAPPEGPPCAP